MKRRYGLLMWLLMATGCASGTPSSNLPKVEGKPTATADGGLVLHVSKTLEKDKSTDLDVYYQWGSATEREATTVDAGESWRVIFPDRPPPDSLTALRLRFTFDAKDEDRRAAAKEVAKLPDELLSAVATTLKERNNTNTFDAIFSTNASKLDATLNELAQYRLGANETLADVAMRELGLSRVNGLLRLTEMGKDALIQLSLDDANRRAWESFGTRQAHKAAKLKNSALDSECKKRYPDDAKGLAFEDAKKLVRVCRDALVSDLKNAHDTYATGRGSAAVAAHSGDWNQVVAARDAVAGVDVDSPAETFDVREFRESRLVAALGDVDKKEKDYNGQLTGAEPPFGPLASDRFAYAATMAAVTWAKAADIEERRKKLIAGVASRTKTLLQQQSASILIEREEERRWFDVSTGFVYVEGLDDWVFPLMLAFCPIGGCLQHGEHLASRGGISAGNAWSVDIGARGAILDDPADIRHKDQPGLLFGVSFNPIYFVRASSGMYTYQNAQSDAWNFAGYAGVTFNIIHAVDMLNSIGMSPKFDTVNVDKEN